MQARTADRFQLDGAEMFEALEGRQLLSGDLPFVQYYPEGFASGRVSEFVPMTNPNDAPAAYELWARYETGERDQLISRGEIEPGSRGGVTVTDARAPGSMLVRRGTPYALELRSSAPISATLSHYDFDVSIGEAFTAGASTDWSFAQAERDDSTTRDFVVVYNTSDDAAVVSMTLIGDDSRVFRYSHTIEGRRRGGWSLNDLPGLASGSYGVVIHGSRPVVAALSHYEVSTSRGYGTLGQSSGGATAGVLTAIEVEHHRRGGRDDRGGGTDDPPGDDRLTPASRALVSLLNATGQPANVTLTFLSRDRADTPIRSTQVVRLEASSRQVIDVGSLAFGADDDIALAYRSDVPVTLAAAVSRGLDSTGAEAATVGATTWDFGEGYMATTRRAGLSVFEDIYAFNPGSASVTVHFDFFLADGSTLRLSERLDSLETEDVSIHDWEELLLRAPVFFGVRVTASSPIVASLEHWDDDLGGGFATMGTPSGLVVPLSEVLAI